MDIDISEIDIYNKLTELIIITGRELICATKRIIVI